MPIMLVMQNRDGHFSAISTNFHTKLTLNGQLQYHTEVHGLLDKLDNMYTKFYLNFT